MIPKKLLSYMPATDKPDADCTLLELWARYCEDISLRFQNPKETVSQYTSSLMQIQEELSLKKASEMTSIDCLQAVQAQKSYMTSTGPKPYAEETPRYRLTVLRDIFAHCENRGIPSPLRYTPPTFFNTLNWNTTLADLKKQFASKAKMLRSKYKDDLFPEYLLVKKAVNNLLGPKETRDGRWLGILIYIYLGVRPYEGINMTHDGFHPFTDHPDAYYFDLTMFGDGKGDSKLRGKTRNAIRHLPVHPELLTILKEIWRELEQEYGTTKGLPVIFLGNSFITKCTGLQMLQFARKELQAILNEDKLADLATIVYAEEDLIDHLPINNLEARMDDDISTRLFRHYFALKMHAATNLADTDIRAIMGHKQDDRIKDLFKEKNVYLWLLEMSSFTILSELREDLTTIISSEMNKYEVSMSAHTLFIPKNVAKDGLCLDISMLSKEPGGNLMIELPEDLLSYIDIKLLSTEYFPVETLRDPNRRVDTSYDQYIRRKKERETNK